MRRCLCSYKHVYICIYRMFPFSRGKAASSVLREGSTCWHKYYWTNVLFPSVSTTKSHYEFNLVPIRAACATQLTEFIFTDCNLVILAFLNVAILRTKKFLMLQFPPLTMRSSKAAIYRAAHGYINTAAYNCCGYLTSNATLFVFI